MTEHCSDFMWWNPLLWFFSVNLTVVWTSLLLHRAQMAAAAAAVQLLLAATLWMLPHTGPFAAAALLPSSTELLNTTVAATQSDFRMLTGAVGLSRSRRKRAISSREMNALLDYHNRVRSQVFPPAANMEYMVRHWGGVSDQALMVVYDWRLIHFNFKFVFKKKTKCIKQHSSNWCKGGETTKKGIGKKDRNCINEKK